MRLPLIAFFSFAVLSSVQSVHPLTSITGQYGRWEGLSTIACYFILYLAAHAVARNRGLERPLILAILISSAIVSIVAIVEYFWTNPFLLFAKAYCSAGFGQPNAFETGRSMATFGNAAFLAAYLALILPIIISYVVVKRDDAIPKVASYGALLLVVVALLLTFGRGAWVGAAVGIALVGWLNWSAIKRYRSRALIVTAIFALAFIGVAAVAQSYSLPGRIASIFTIEGSALARIQMWDASLPLIPDAPLLGSGPDTFKYVFGKYKPEGWVEHISDPLLDKAHNDSLQVAVTHGIPGLTAYFWVFIAFLWAGIRRVCVRSNPRDTWLAAGMLGAVLGYFVQMQFSFSHFTVSPLVWVFMGLVSGRLLTADRGKTVEIGVIERQRIPAYGVLVLSVVSLAMMSLTPLVADIYFSKGRELQSRKQLPQALRYYESAVSANSLEPLYRISLAETLLQLGASTGNTGYITLGSTAFAGAQRLNPLDEQAYFRAGAAFLEAGRRLEKPSFLRDAITVHEQGLTLNPIMVDAYTDIGVAYAYLNRYDDAVGAWSDALSIEPNNDRVYFNLGWVYEQKGERAEAKEAYLKAYRLNPKMIEAKAAYDRL